MAYWTHGKLMFGGDGASYYNYYNFLQGPSFSSMIWVFTELVSFNNIYTMYYFHLFLGTLFSVSGIYILSRLVLKNVSAEKAKMLGLAASLLFLFNPWSVELTYLSLIGDVSIGVGGLTFFFIGLFLFLNDGTHLTRMRRFSPIVAGIGLGKARSPFPNYIRLLSVVIVVFLLLGLISIVNKRTRNLQYFKYLSIFALSSIFISICLSLEYFIPIVTRLHATIALANSGAADKVYLGFYTAQFNDILNELRGLSGWQYPGIFYYSQYVNFGAIFMISFLWPIFALVMPLLFTRYTNKNDTLRIFILVLALLLVVFWDKSKNAPFGQLWIIISSYFPTGYEFILTGYLTSIFINIFFPILSALSLLCIYDLLSSHLGSLRGKKLIFKRFRKIAASRHVLPLIIPIARTLLLVASAYPAFVGYAETYSYNGSNKSNQGFLIPNSYYNAKAFLADNNTGSVLLLPPTTSNPYITTDWGYSGEIGFYSSFFAPINIITFNNFGGTYSNATQQLEYSALTQPPINSTNAINQYVATLKEYKISYILIDSSITSGIAETANQSYSLVENLVNASFAKIVFVDGDLTIASINYDKIKSNEHVLYSEAANTNTQQVKIYPYNQNASRFQNSEIADAGNTVTFSVPGYKGTIPPAWNENGSFLARSFFENIPFPSQGMYNTSTQLPNGTVLHVNYTVNRKMVAIISAPNIVLAGITAYFSGAILGETTHLDVGYNWEWYINGVYQKSIGDANYGIPIIFNNTGTYNITLVIHDILFENTSVYILLHVLNPKLYKIDTGLRDNVTRGSLFYYFVIILAAIESIIYVRTNRRRK